MTMYQGRRQGRLRWRETAGGESEGVFKKNFESTKNNKDGKRTPQKPGKGGPTSGYAVRGRSSGEKKPDNKREHLKIYGVTAQASKPSTERGNRICSGGCTKDIADHY